MSQIIEQEAIQDKEEIFEQQLVKFLKKNCGEGQIIQRKQDSEAQSTITKASTNHSLNDDCENSQQQKRSNLGSEEELSSEIQCNVLTLEAIIQQANNGNQQGSFQEQKVGKNSQQLKNKNLKINQQRKNSMKDSDDDEDQSELTKNKSEVKLIVSKKADQLKQQNRVTSASFVNRQHTKKWTEDETKKFYKGLELFGTDFSLISKLFPTRNRIQVKNKFRKEEKDDITKVDEFLRRNRQMRQKKIQQKLQSTKELINCNQLDIKDRIKLLIDSNRNRRLMSCSSIDTLDIIVNEEITDLQKHSLNNYNLQPPQQKN